MRDASLERTSYGSLLDSPAFGALRDRGTTRRPTIPRQGSGRRVSCRLSVKRAVTAEGQPILKGVAWPRFVVQLRSGCRNIKAVGDIVLVDSDRGSREQSAAQPVDGFRGLPASARIVQLGRVDRARCTVHIFRVGDPKIGVWIPR